MGDIHLTNKRPRNRIDNYSEVQFEKMWWIFEQALEKRCKVIILPGDIFDDFKISKISDRLKRRYIDFYLRAWNEGIEIYAVPGQHDLRYHNPDYSNTPFGVLEAAGCYKDISLNDKPHIYNMNSHKKEDIQFYGAGWEKKIPEIENEKAFNVLVIHKLLIHKKKIWPGQKNYTTANSFLNKHDFDLIVSGDNHQQFITTIDDKTLINAGSLMRAKSDQFDHKPAVFIYNTKHRSIEKISIPIEPIEKVMKVELIQEDKKREEKMNLFVESLPMMKSKKSDIDLKKNLRNYRNEIKLKKRTNQILDDVIRRAERKHDHE